MARILFGLLAISVFVLHGVNSLQVGNGSASNIWAVLVAGSNEYYNYRHQADICHSYHVLHNHGVLDEHIIVMMYDDIAQNEQNPMKGQIINHPKGKDVYAGVPKDYTGKLVTAENLMKILNGEAPKGGSGKVLKSGPDDYVFINYVDHGAPGILGFPSPAPDLTAKELLGSLKKLNDAKKYKQLVLYIESCESGSMFNKKLPKNMNIYATTAANPKESSYACYYDAKLDTYVGDCYSVTWMEDSDKENLDTETLKFQFEKVKKLVNESHVMEYGELTMATDPVGDFQGTQQSLPIVLPEVTNDVPVPSPDVPVRLLIKKIEAEHDLATKALLQEKLAEIFEKRSFVQSLFNEIVENSGHSNPDRIMVEKHDLLDVDCHDDAVKYFSKVCLKTSQNPFTYRYIYTLVNLCEEKVPIENIRKAMDFACSNIPPEMINIL